MNRRFFLLSLLSLPVLSGVPASRLRAQPARPDVDDPYAEIDWDNCRFIHSMSHQHQGLSDASAESFYAMGYRHLAFSNYYPSAPTPLSDEFMKAHPDAIGSPNAEQHSFLDSGLHFCSLGSALATGDGHFLSGAQMDASPLAARFENLHVFDAGNQPWRGVYRLDLTLREKAKGATATLSIEGATECEFAAGFPLKEMVTARPLAAGAYVLYLRANSPAIALTLDYDKAQIAVSQCRLMQGANRPWRDVFRAALDQLQYTDGGGITLNHPTSTLAEYVAMLDFDERVLGIEVWNQLTTGFGSPRGFFDKTPGPHLHFYNLWDGVLRTGRRCLGFFVKDHISAGRGRNILLLPDLSGLSREQRERAALRAYRNGAFFGSIAALHSDGEEVVPPFDDSQFRFSRVALKRDAGGVARALEVAVSGNDAKRPNIQIRFVTERGIEHIVDAAQAEFALSDVTQRRFVRVEAFAYPSTHNNGQALTKEDFRRLNVEEISLLHDKRLNGGPAFFGLEQEFPARLPIADMIFSQPIRFLR
jgi:hypothetical protein